MQAVQIVASTRVVWPRALSRCGHRPLLQRGQVLLLSILVLMGIGVALFVSTASSEVMRAADADARTRAALEQARSALIASAVGHTFRPGSLPCPDTDDDGTSEPFSAGECPSYIGRLPWKTLGIGDVRDEAGERLWYAVSPNFRDQPTVRINSDTKGTQTVFSISPTTVFTTQAVAIVFAPGTVLPGQLRDSVIAACTMSGTSVNMRHDLCASNYLESQSGATPAWSNATASGPYMTARPSLTFNDKLTVLRTTDFMHLVERRAARDLNNILLDYRNQSLATGGCNCYPWPDRDGDGSSDADNNRGHIPIGGGRFITAITRASPAVVTTSAAHTLATGQAVYLTDIAGMAQLNGTIASVTVLNATQFSIPVNTSAYGLYASGGRALPSALPHSFYRSIASITNATQAIITTTAPHGFSTGLQLYLSGIAGMTELNGAVVTVTAIDPIDSRKFTIDVNTTSYGIYTSGGTTAPRAMRYLEPNDWAKVIYYTVAKAGLDNGGLTCTSCIPAGPDTLSVNGTNGYGVVLITPGPVAPSQVRTTWAHYIDDGENRDASPQAAAGGATADPAANDSYIQPPGACPSGQCPTTVNGVTRCVASPLACPRNVTARARDQLHYLTSAPPNVQCGATAQMLLNNAPCHTTGTNVKAICEEARSNLASAGCSCSLAANALVSDLSSPCRNTLRPPACQTAVKALKSCVPT